MTKRDPINVVLVEDDDALGPAVAQALQLEGIEVALFSDAVSAMRALPNDFLGVVVSDVRLPGMDGLALFAQLQQQDPDLPIIITTGHGDVEMAVAAMKGGAADFLTKPYSSAALIRAITVAAERRRLVLENRRLRNALKQQAQNGFIGPSEFAVRLRAMLSAVAQTEVDVVVEGEPGTGKTFVARLIHELGPRHSRPFVTVDAGTLTHEDVDLLLFGREPGRGGLSRTGLIERANGGTLLIDEIETASPALQARLLSVLGTRSFLPAGAERSRKLNLSVVVTRQLSSQSDHPDPDRSMFHERLSAIRVMMVPLANRREDIAPLFQYFLTRQEAGLGLPHREVTGDVWQHLQTHEWTGNVRELEAFAQSWVIGLNLPNEKAPLATDSRPLHLTVAEFERTVIQNALQAVEGNIQLLEKALGTPRKTLYDKLNRYGLRPKDFRLVAESRNK
jgi:two-component system C4-dicarboxylate transport response regulator DctD